MSTDDRERRLTIRVLVDALLETRDAEVREHVHIVVVFLFAHIVKFLELLHDELVVIAAFRSSVDVDAEKMGSYVLLVEISHHRRNVILILVVGSRHALRSAEETQGATDSSIRAANGPLGQVAIHHGAVGRQERCEIHTHAEDYHSGQQIVCDDEIIGQPLVLASISSVIVAMPLCGR